MNRDDYRRIFGGRDNSAPGWDAIDSRFRTLYPNQEPKHWGTIISYMLGGPDPLDGISVYQCTDGGTDHWHFVTYGLTSLYYDEEAAGDEFSGIGFEMTFRLARPLPPDEESLWVCNLLQNLARYILEIGRWFEQYHWINANGPIRADCDTAIVGLAFLNDPALEPIESPHGRVKFIQVFGITQNVLASFKDTKQTAEELIEHHRRANPLLITDLARRDA